MSLLLMGGASALGYRQTPLRAFVFVGVGNEEKYMAAPCYWRSTVDRDTLENGVEIHATAAFELPSASLPAPRRPQIGPGHLPTLPRKLYPEDVRDTDDRHKLQDKPRASCRREREARA